jgi:hypothetical protein
MHVHAPTQQPPAPLVLAHPAGFDEEGLNEILAQPAALMADLSWLPAQILAATTDDGEAAEEAEGGQQQGPRSIGDMSLAQLAKVRLESCHPSLPPWTAMHVRGGGGESWGSSAGHAALQVRSLEGTRSALSLFTFSFPSSLGGVVVASVSMLCVLGL